VGKFIPVEPEKWAEMVKAQAEVERLKMEQRLKAVPVEAKLLDRIAELKAEVEELTGLLKASTYYNTSDEVTRLKAEVERLTEAGDDLVLHVEWRNVVIVDPTLSFFKVSPDCLCNCHNFDKVIERWNAAKKGGQP
jgi:maltodextrin utilization protein YvdJ